MALLATKLELRSLGIKLSRVGFGAAPLGNVFGPVSENDVISSVGEAFRLGINFFDTSPNEQMFSMKNLEKRKMHDRTQKTDSLATKQSAFEGTINRAGAPKISDCL